MPLFFLTEPFAVIQLVPSGSSVCKTGLQRFTEFTSLCLLRS